MACRSCWNWINHCTRRTASLGVFSIVLTWLVIGCASGDLQRKEVGSHRRAANAIRLSGVKVESKHDTIQVVITGSKPFPYGISSLDEPPRIVVDIPHARFVDLPAVLNIEQGGVETVTLGQSPEDSLTAQLRIQLVKHTAYTVAKDRKRLSVGIQRAPMNAAAPDVDSAHHVPHAEIELLPQAYVMGRDDVLDINVYGEPELSKKHRVGGDGFIPFPLIGSVRVEGRTAAQIEDDIQGRLAQGFLINPQVSVAVAAYESQHVFVLGAVEKPGQFPLRGKTTLLEMLSRVGGLNVEGGQIKSLVLIREGDTQGALKQASRKNVKTLHIDLQRLLKQGDMSLNVTLQKRDVIYVPRPASVFVFGQVKNPGPVPLTDNFTVVQVINQAGGLAEYAAPRRTRVIRVVDGVERIMRVNVNDIIKRGERHKDIVLEAGDIVVVPESLL